MLKKSLILSTALALVIFASKPAQAYVTMYDTFSAWQAAVTGINYVNLNSLVGITLAAGTPINMGSSNLTFNDSFDVVQVPNGWATWSGGNTPVVLPVLDSSVTGTLSNGGLMALGLEMEPNTYDNFDMTLSFTGGSLTQSVSGISGAKFFGFVSDQNIATFDLSTVTAAEGFAFGRLVYATPGASTDAVPEPASLILLGMGGVGMALRRMHRKNA